MSFGSTVVDVVTVVTPVVGVLLGARIAQRSEREKRRDEARLEAAKVACDAVRADQDAEEQAVAGVITSGVAWRSDLASLALSFRIAMTDNDAVVYPNAMFATHRDFGTAVHSGLVRLDDQSVRNALNDCAQCFNDGFDLVRDVSDPRQISGVPEANKCDGLVATLGARLTTLQEVARAYLAERNAPGLPRVRSTPHL